MRKTRRWPVFLVIATLVATAVLAGSAAALAEEAQGSASVDTRGVIEALVWDDFKSPDGKYTDADLVDGIKVNLYHLEEKQWVTSLDPTVENFEGPDPNTYLFYMDSKNLFGGTVREYWNGKWVLVGSKLTGPGGYVFG